MEIGCVSPNTWLSNFVKKLIYNKFFSLQLTYVRRIEFGAEYSLFKKTYGSTIHITGVKTKVTLNVIYRLKIIIFIYFLRSFKSI